MSTHEIAVVSIDKIEPHPDPKVERMEITHMWGWQCCLGKGQFQVGDKAIFIPPDYMVPLDHPSFAFLSRDDGAVDRRIKVRRLRGAVSQGLLIAMPPELADLPVGANAIDQLRIKRYIPPENLNAMFIGGPSGIYSPKFDVESYQRFLDQFEDGEEVVVTEKMHGTSARYVWSQDKDGEWKQFCGTRVNWVGEPTEEKDKKKSNPYWTAFSRNPAIGDWCRKNPNKILYGEVFGQVKKFKYGGERGQLFFAAFAILEKNDWVDFGDCQELVEGYDIDWAPVLYQGKFDREICLKLAEGNSSWTGANHIREGVVVVPIHERTDPEIGRVVLKVVSNRYLEKDYD